jgi:hypothetical protein
MRRECLPSSHPYVKAAVAGALCGALITFGLRLLLMVAIALNLGGEMKFPYFHLLLLAMLPAVGIARCIGLQLHGAGDIPFTSTLLFVALVNALLLALLAGVVAALFAWNRSKISLVGQPGPPPSGDPEKGVNPGKGVKKGVTH